jgi:amino-acid N-acetyltransferase
VPAIAEVRIEIPTREDWRGVAGLLADAGLPALDDNALADDFRVARNESVLLGAIGIERYGAHGLLRSLVVAPSARGQRLGERLVAAIEQHASAACLHELILLTTTAETFFARLGYARFARDEMPAAVRASAEFSTLCPASAVCMRKPLAARVPA